MPGPRVRGSFNAVTVDSDMSTSDTLMLFATGQAAKRGQAPVTAKGDARLGGFRRALNALLLDLAVQVARDGEGARKLIEVTVEGATSSRSAKRIAMSIANSPLVKTAVAGEDANWGRIVMAVGKAANRPSVTGFPFISGRIGWRMRARATPPIVKRPYPIT